MSVRRTGLIATVVAVLIAAAVTLGATSAATARPPGPDTPAVVDTHGLNRAERAHATAAVALLEQSFTEHQPAAAAEAYIDAATYIQHNPAAADGRDAFVAFVEGFVGQFPDTSITVVRVVAQGDLVVTHSLLKTRPDDRGTVAADFFRFNRNGKIVEHWDVLQPVAETSVNGNPQI